MLVPSLSSSPSRSEGVRSGTAMNPHFPLCVRLCRSGGVRLDALDFLAPELRAELTRTAGFPHLDAGLQSSVPGLYFTGIRAAATFGPVLRFTCGTEFAAPRPAAALAARA